MDLAEIQRAPYSKEQMQSMIRNLTQDPLTRLLLQAEGSLYDLLCSYVDPHVLHLTLQREEIVSRASFPVLGVINDTVLIQERTMRSGQTPFVHQNSLIVTDRLPENGVSLLPVPTLETLYERLPLRRRTLHLGKHAGSPLPGLVRTYRLESTGGKPLALVTDILAVNMTCLFEEEM